MQQPEGLHYTREHEWLRLEGQEAVIGITDFAQESLGDVVFVELPAAGTELTAGKPFGVVESNKSVSDLFAPVSGRVVAVNTALADVPEAVNRDPYGDGWLIRIAVAAPEQLEQLLDAAQYRGFVESEHAK
jgi:glycine cleavage system H protein